MTRSDAVAPRGNGMAADAPSPPTPTARLERVYRKIVAERALAWGEPAEIARFIEDLARLPGVPEAPRLAAGLAAHLASRPAPFALWRVAREVAAALPARARDALLDRHDARVVGGRFASFRTAVEAASEARRRIVFVATEPPFVALRQAMALRRDGNACFLITLHSLGATVRAAFEAGFDAVVDAASSPWLLDGLLRSIDTDVLHVQCRMWETYVGRLAIESARTTPVVCDFYDITSVYADRDLLCTNWSPTLVDLDLFLERWIIRRADAIVHRFPPHVVDEVRARHGAMPPETAMFAYPSPDFVDYGPVRPPGAEGPIRLVYAGTAIPMDDRHPPALFPEHGMPAALRALLDADFAVDLIGRPDHASSGETAGDDAMAALAQEFPGMGLRPGVPPTALSSTLNTYDFGLVLMAYDADVVRIGEGQRTGVVANKIFSYFEAGLPVIVNAEYEAMARLVEDNGVGLAVLSRDLPGLAERLAAFDRDAARANVRRYNEENAMPRHIERLSALYDRAAEARRPA